MSGGTAPGLAVVIIAHGRYQHLRRTLRSLAQGRRLPEQVVVVAMADPGIGALVGELDLPGLEVRVVELDCDPYRLALAAARNLGARTAAASTLVFLDVDCLAGPSLVGDYEGAVDRLASTSPERPFVVGGPVTYLPQDWQQRCAGQGGDELSTLRQPHGARPDPQPGQLQPEDRLELFWSLSFAVRAEDFWRIGGFDEAYLGYGGEDTDFAKRLERAGGRLWWVGGADAFHQYHPVSTPPVEHLDDIVRNVALFQDRWGGPCMNGWLAAFAELGLVEHHDDGQWRRRPAEALAGQVLHVVPGPQDHGITRHALHLLRQGEAPVLRLPSAAATSPEQLAHTIIGCAARRGVHLHLNDQLMGQNTVQVVQRVAEVLTASLTLHDLPDLREGAARYERRALACTDLWRASSGVVVASRHERGLLEEAARQVGAQPGQLPPVRVMPLPLDAASAPASPGLPGGTGASGAGERALGLEPVVAVLGYLYPGKGHEQAIRLAAAVGMRAVVALGTTSAGHEQLADDLARQAFEAGIGWEMTGFLDDQELMARARRVALPLAWHAHASASGSIGTWLEAGRRPLVADGGWARELAERCPGTLTMVRDEAELVQAARRVLAGESSSFLALGTRLEPSAAQAWQSTAEAIEFFHQPSQTARGRHGC